MRPGSHGMWVRGRTGPGLLRRSPRGLSLGTLLLALLAAGTAASQPRKQPNGVSWGELAMLPEYCKDANGIVWGDRYFNRSPNADRWEALMGLDFWHIHHYCYALNNLRKASFTVNQRDKRYLLQKVRADYGYVINNSSPTMVLLPEIWTRMGDVEVLLGDVGAALDAYEKAIARKPDYWPPYKNAAEMFLKAGVRHRAMDLLVRGIRANPTSTQLREAYKSAGGDPARLPALPLPDTTAGEAKTSTADSGTNAASATSAPAPGASSP